MRKQNNSERSEDLRAFMAKNVEFGKETEFAVSKRFKKSNGEPEKWILRTITAKEDAEIRKSCTSMVPSKRSRGALMPKVDTDEYLTRMIAECVVYPNLNSKDLQDSYGVMGSSDLLGKMLNPGEYADLTKKVQEINGFDIVMEDLVDEAKN